MSKHILKKNKLEKIKYLNIHQHDQYSIQDGFGSPAEYVHRACECGHESIAQTNHGNLAGSLDLYFEHLDNPKLKNKPILGMEAYIFDDTFVNKIDLLARELEKNFTKIK